MARKAQFTRPEYGFSLYEGRTRGKRMKYTFSDEEDDGSDDTSTRRSTRNSGVATPADPLKPTVTASGRRVKSRLGGMYGESLLSGQGAEEGSQGARDQARSDVSEEHRAANGRSTRSGGNAVANGWAKGEKHIQGYNSVDELDDEEDASSTGEEWNGDEEEDFVDANMEEEDGDEEDFSDDVSDGDLASRPKRSLVVQLRYSRPVPQNSTSVPSALPQSSVAASIRPDALATTSEPLANGSAQNAILVADAGITAETAQVSLPPPFFPKELVDHQNHLHDTSVELNHVKTYAPITHAEVPHQQPMDPVAVPMNQV